MKVLKSFQILSLILVVFFLPLNLNLNNISLVLFIFSSFLLFFLKEHNKKKNRIKANALIIILLSIPFLLNFFGLFYSKNLDLAIDYNIRALPFLLLPILAVTSKELFLINYKKMGIALVLGCLLTVFCSWTFLFFEIIQLNRPFSSILGPLYTHHNLLKPLDLHAAYVSICIYTAIGFIIKVFSDLNKLSKWLYSIAVLFLALFMVQLLSRNALIFSFFSFSVLLVLKRKWRILLISYSLILLAVVGAYNIKHNYLRDRLFNSLNLFEKPTRFSKKDDRFDRLSASYEIFERSPIYGYGTASEDSFRREVFKRNRDQVAYQNNYNAHNQFFEYLSTFGIIGGIAYFIFFASLFYLVIRIKKGFFTFIAIGLFLACTTESVFERSQGVVYASLFLAILISYYKRIKV
tara:strand:+ start:612 stop:1832 length:1221 start_codon:yes stop_codon:yes gene_type:complete